MDTKAIEYHVRGILEAIGEDPDSEGLRETPARVAQMLEEVLEGIAYSNHEIAEMFGKTFDNDCLPESENAVIMRDITVFSYCEHHLALMYDMSVNVAYVPRGKVLGLSKIARICDMAAKRLQLQERIGRDICEIISEAAGTPDVGVVISGCHSCMTARGIRNDTAKTVTTTYLGAVQGRRRLSAELLRKGDNMKALVFIQRRSRLLHLPCHSRRQIRRERSSRSFRKLRSKAQQGA